MNEQPLAVADDGTGSPRHSLAEWSTSGADASGSAAPGQNIEAVAADAGARLVMVSAN